MFFQGDLTVGGIMRVKVMQNFFISYELNTLCLYTGKYTFIKMYKTKKEEQFIKSWATAMLGSIGDGLFCCQSPTTI